MSLHHLLAATLGSVCALVVSSVQADSVIIEADADNTLIEDPQGSLSNGSGPVFHVGRRNQQQNSRRRAVLYFDVAGNLPPGAVVESASVTLYLERGTGGERTLRLHRLRADWGEGGSSTRSALGAPAQPGDATWLNTFYPDQEWERYGGWYLGRVSTSQVVGDPVEEIDPPAYYTWDSTARLVQDIRMWLREPERNHGWILIGDESEPQTIKRFASRETTADPAFIPVLELEYDVDL